MDSTGKRRRRSYGGSDLRLDSGSAAAAVAPEVGEEGLAVWAKYDTYRPYPAYIIRKRRQNTGQGVPVMFCNEVEEFAWVPTTNVLPLEISSFAELCRDCDTEPEMLSALRKLFADEVFPCIACTLCFVREEYLQQHLDQKHDHPELLDHDVLLARAKFFYQLRRAIVDAEKNPIVSCLDSEMKLPPLQSSSVAPLLAMIEAVPPMGEWTTEELAAMAAEDDARRQTECDRQLLQQRLEETAEAAADGGTAVATTTPTDVVAPTAGSSAVQDTAKRISESDTAANCSAAEPTLPRRSPPPGRPVGGPIGMYADDVPYERPTATDAAAAATNSDGTAPANRVVRPGRTTSWATDGAAGQDDGVDAAITAAGPGAQGSSSSQHHGPTRTPSLLARRSFLSAPGATSSLTRTVSAVLSEGAAPSQEQQESEYSRARIRVDEAYQVSSEALPEPVDAPISESTGSPRSHLVWEPLPEMEELEGYHAYLKFATSRGLHFHHDHRFKTGDTEYAHHVLYNVMLTKRKPVITHALLDVTEPTRVKLMPWLQDYHYQGMVAWNERERYIFRKAYEEYGKNFHYIHLTVGSRSLREVIEYYYTEFKRAAYFTSIKEELRERERAEAERAANEGLVTSCDHCKRSNTPRWREGPSRQDLCDRCYFYHKRTNQLPKLDNAYVNDEQLRYQDWMADAPTVAGRPRIRPSRPPGAGYGPPSGKRSRVALMDADDDDDADDPNDANDETYQVPSSRGRSSSSSSRQRSSKNNYSSNSNIADSNSSSNSNNANANGGGGNASSKGGNTGGENNNNDGGGNREDDAAAHDGDDHEDDDFGDNHGRPGSASSDEAIPSSNRRHRLKGCTTCPECGKEFAQSSSLYGHLRVHSRALPGETKTRKRKTAAQKRALVAAAAAGVADGLSEKDAAELAEELLENEMRQDGVEDDAGAGEAEAEGEAAAQAEAAPQPMDTTQELAAPVAPPKPEAPAPAAEASSSQPGETTLAVAV